MLNSDFLLGRTMPATADKDEPSDFSDSKIAFFAKHCEGKSVLDLGCVEHNPENYRSRYWVHKALRIVSQDVLGLDLYEEGVVYLNEMGFNVVVGNAEAFALGRTFDVICAGDLVEHLANPGGMFESARSHLVAGGKVLVTTPNPWYWRFIVKASVSYDVRPNPEHTCWFCPRTLSHLASRYGFRLDSISFGSRFLRDRILPMPRVLKHTTFFASFVKSED